MTDQSSESCAAYPPDNDRVLRSLGILVLVALLLLFLASTDSSSHGPLIAYTDTSFSGEPVSLRATSGRCEPMPTSVRAKSVRNDTSLYATFFADPYCAMPVAVVAPGETDTGFVLNNGSRTAFDDPALSLLGTKGTFSYRTVTATGE